jgi:hypothetical protein
MNFFSLCIVVIMKLILHLMEKHFNHFFPKPLRYPDAAVTSGDSAERIRAAGEQKGKRAHKRKAHKRKAHKRKASKA